MFRDTHPRPFGVFLTVDVSVLTPSYGYGRFIRDCILSVGQQEGVSVEHIVQDAASTDGTVEVLREFDRTVRWVSEPDFGQSDALNKALERSMGRWVAWLNADEFYLPGALAALVAHAERSRADVVYGECVFVDEDGRFERLVPEHVFSGRILREFGCFISSSSVLIRRESLGLPPWDTEVKRIMDWDLYMQLLTAGAHFSHLIHPIGAFRRHIEQVTHGEWWEWREETRPSTLATDYRPIPSRDGGGLGREGGSTRSTSWSAARTCGRSSPEDWRGRACGGSRKRPAGRRSISS